MSTLIYRLDETPSPAAIVLSTLQWVVFILANLITVPIVLGEAFGMQPGEIALYSSRTFVVCGLVGILQVTLGHRLPIIEGPAGTWWGVFVVLIQMTKDTGGSLSALQQELELGLIIAGAVSVLLVLFGLLNRLRQLFTPAVTGTFMVLLALQLSKSLVSGMLGIGFHQSTVVSGKVAAISLVLVVFTITLMLRGKGLIKSLAVLLGLLLGWIVYGVLGMLDVPPPGQWFAWPGIFPAGRVHLNLGIVATCAVTSLVLLSNLIASIQAMSAVSEIPVDSSRFARGTLVTGIGTALSGLTGTVGNIPLAVSASLVSLSNIASRLPFLIASAIIFILGFFPDIGRLTATLPAPVGYAVLFTVFGQLLGIGLQDFRRMKMDQRDLFVITLPILAGGGMFFLSGAAWGHVPGVAADLLGNGLLLGVVLAVILEHLVFRQTRRNSE